MVEGLLVTWLGLGRAGTVFLPPGGPQKRSGEPSTGWFPLLCLLTFSGGTLRVPFSLRGLAARGPSPFVAARHFPRTAGESSPPPQGLRSRFGRRLICAPLAHGAL